MPSHICTAESFLKGGIKVPCTCSVCMVETTHVVGFVLSKCENCKTIIDHDGGCENLVRLRREHLKLTRKEMAKATGLKVKTIRYYETWIPSKKYIELTGKMVKDEQRSN